MPRQYLGSGRMPLSLATLETFRFGNGTRDSLSVRVHLDDGSIKKSRLASGEDLEFKLEKTGRAVSFKFQNKPVSFIDLNDGKSSDDLTISTSHWPGENNLHYKPRFFSFPVNMIDFGKQTYLRHYRDPDGVAGNAGNDIFQQYVEDDAIVMVLNSSLYAL